MFRGSCHSLPVFVALTALAGCQSAPTTSRPPAPAIRHAAASGPRGDLHFPPVPAEDRARGRNDNAYNAARNASAEEQTAFVQWHTATATSLARRTGVPASVLLAMSCVESGYGFTRTAVNANNYFGIKNQSGSLDQVYQLIGQPNEDGPPRAFALEVIDGDENRIIFDEARRRTNRYRRFASPADAFTYLATVLLQNDRYRGATAAYASHRAAGMSRLDAAEEFARDIGERGYHHRGGNYYRDQVIAPILRRHHLTQLDP